MAILQSGGFGLRTLPQLQRINPADFRIDPRAATAARTAETDARIKLEQLQAIQRKADIERAVQGDTEALARLQSGAAVEDFPVRRQADLAGLQAGTVASQLEGEKAGQTLRSVQTNEDITAQTADVDAANRLRQAQEAKAIEAQDRALKEREQSRRETETGSLVGARESAAALNQARIENEQLRLEIARIKAEQGGGDKGMQIRTTPIIGIGSEVTGINRTIFNPNTGKFETTTEMFPKDGSTDMGALMPGGAGATPATGAAVPASTPAVQAGYATPDELVKAVRTGQLTAMQAKVIAVENGWRQPDQ